MISRTKYKIDNQTIEQLFANAGIFGAAKIAPLGAGEYNAVFSIEADGKHYALKIAPTDDVPVLTYETNMMASETFWYRQMREQTSITVPKIYFTDFTKQLIPANYFIMEKLPGEQLDKMELTDCEREDSQAEMAKMTAQLHKIRNDKFGYIQNGLYDDWYQAISEMVKNLLGDCMRKGKKSRRGRKLLSYIDQYKSVLEKAECSMVSFDIWPPNIICSRENGKIQYAWIDPERSFWGDRIVDFVCLEMMTPLEDKKISLAAYNSIADSPVAAIKDEVIRYAVALGYLALIMETEKYFRYTPLNFGWWRNVSVSGKLFNSTFQALRT